MGATMTARAKKENAQAEIAQLKIEKMRSGSAGRRSRGGLDRHCQSIRAACTALQPTRVACAGLTEAQARVVRTAIREVLAELG